MIYALAALSALAAGIALANEYKAQRRLRRMAREYEERSHEAS